MNNPKITGIVCTRNREVFLAKCLDSMLNQTLSRDQFEVLVVDNGSTDGTAALLKKYAGKGVRNVYEPVPGLSRARNAGWQAAKGDYVGYLDDDGVAESNWFKSALECFETISPSPEWVGGPIFLDCEVHLPVWIDAELRVPLGEVDWGLEARFLTKRERLGGGNSFYHRKMLADVGGFDERLGRDGKSLLSADETQLQKRVEANGGRLYYHPGVAMRHYVGLDRIQPKWFYSRYYWGGISDVVMTRTFRGTSLEYSVDSEECSENARCGASAKLVRCLSNSLAAIGLGFDRTKRIRSRIYMSYVFGRIMAFTGFALNIRR